MHARTRHVLAFASLLVATACGGEPKTVTGPTAKAEPTPTKVDAPAAEPVKLVEGPAPGDDDRFAVAIETPEAAAGQEAKVTLKVVPKAPWHMNLDYPTSLALTAPADVKLVKAALEKHDATQLDEGVARFDVAFTPEHAGEQEFTGKFKFAVCEESACVPVTQDVTFKVAVK